VGVAPNASTAQVEDLDGGSEDLGKIHMEGGMEVVEMEMAGTLGSTIHVLLPTAPQISPPPPTPTPPSISSTSTIYLQQIQIEKSGTHLSLKSPQQILPPSNPPEECHQFASGSNL
jgi:hypothetical protein